MKKTLFQLLIVLLPFTAIAQNCDFTFSFNSSSGIITLNSPSGFNQNEYVFLWNLFGEQVFLEGANPSYTYPDNLSIIDNITLNVFQALPDSNLVCTSSLTVEIVVDNPNNCPITFSQTNNNTFAFEIPGANYPAEWNFGDGSTASGFQVNHTFSNPGIYQVCANVTGGGFNCSDCVNVIIQDDSTTYEQVSCSSFCVTDLSLDSSLNEAFLSISYAGNLNSMINYPHVATVTNTSGDTIAIGSIFSFGQFGGTTATYGVSLSNVTQWDPSEVVYVHFVFNDQTCILTYPCQQLPVNCNASFYASTSPLVGYFISTGNTMATTTSYLWDFGDGTTATAANVYHQYAASGLYTVCMIQSSAICSDTICQQVFIPESLPNLPDSLCNAEFAITQQTPYEVIIVNGSSGNDLTFNWTISGNGLSITAQGAYPEIMVEATGAYLLCLTVTSPNCSATYCDSLVVDENGMWNGRTTTSGFVINVMSPQEATGFITSVQELETAVSVVYPNPFTDVMYVSASKASNYEIIAIDGKRIQSGNLPEGQTSLATSDLASGIYFFTQQYSDGSKTVKKIVKQ